MRGKRIEKKAKEEAPVRRSKSSYPQRTIEQQRSAVNALVAGMNKAFKGDVLVKGHDAVVFRRWPSGSKVLDAILGGGYPSGKVIELYGEFGCGKSTTVLKSIAAQQKRGLVCALIDTEMSFDKEYAKACGVDLDLLILHQSSSQEEVIDLIVAMAESGVVNAIYLDSIHGLIPERVEERSAYDPTMGIEAKLNGLLMRKVIPAMNPSNTEPHCLLVLVSQTRAVLGQASAHPIPNQPGGGQAVRFFKHISVRIRRGDKLGEDGEKATAGKPICGQEIIYYTEKNKTFRPYLSGCSRYFFSDAPKIGIKGGNIDTVRELSSLGRQLGVITQAGPYYEIDEKKFKGEMALTEYLRGLEDTTKLEEAIVNALRRGSEVEEKREEGGEADEGD